MSNTKKHVENYKKVLDALDISGPNDGWKVARRATDLSLRLTNAQMDYDKMHGKSRFSAEDRENIKEAVELRRQVYRKVKALKGA
ncbi:MAG: hypothetical protein Q7L07_00545 [Pseudohongiella sp.]|nr:hypothetical protein [Pseudohongiella sp.]MDP2283473.1 hypothetical protein [Pseudohongiella sp.]